MPRPACGRRRQVGRCHRPCDGSSSRACRGGAVCVLDPHRHPGVRATPTHLDAGGHRCLRRRRCVGTSALELVDVRLESIAGERFCELALVFLLFSDSTRIDLAALRQASGLAGQALAIGLPLTIAGRPGGRPARLSRHSAGQRLRSVDDGLLDRCGARAAGRLGQVSAGRVRQALDVESGLNDGLGVPFFLVAVDSRSPGCRPASPPPWCATWPSRSAGVSSPGSAPGRWRAWCSAWRMNAGGWRGNGGRSFPWPRR